MSNPHLVVTQEGAVQTLRLNRPEKKNALDAALYTSLCDALDAAAGNADVRVVVLAGGAELFSSGNDLQDFMEFSGDIHALPVARFLRTLSAFPKPVVAAVNGAAVGIGTTMLLHCDLVYAGENARLQLPFVNLGLCPEFASSYLLPRLLGHVRAAELLMLGESIPAQKALALGLVNEVLPPAEVEARAHARAAQLAAQAPQALRITKRLMRAFHDVHLQQSLQTELDSFGALLQAGEFREAVAAFLGKRKPDFSRFS